jgi:Holliday junction resolvasome RuvABC DNA-binding subunit
VSGLAPEDLGGAVEGAASGGSGLGEEIHGTLMAMGYDQREIQAALRAVAAGGLDPAADPERWLGDCLRWLSRSVA